MSSSGPYFDHQGKCYYVVNGNPVWTSQNTGSIVGEQASAVGRSYRPDPLRHGSWPPTNAPSPLNSRMTSGYPNTLFGKGQSQASGPAAGAEYMDPYRDAMNPQKNPRGAPPNSHFSKEYKSYKDMDKAAVDAAEEYRIFKRTAPSVSRRVRAQNPGVYMGEPLANKEWYQKAAEYALNAAQLCFQASKARNTMGEEFVGYDTMKGADGHHKRAENLKHKGERLMQMYHGHQNSHNDR